MLPVISYKTGGDVTSAKSGKLNSVAEQAAAQLDSFGLPTAVVVWHEPYTDMSGADYAAASRQLLPIFKRGKLRVGPLLNGWLLDRQQDTFGTFCPDDLFQLWDWVGVDTYQSGTMSVSRRCHARRPDPGAGEVPRVAWLPEHAHGCGRVQRLDGRCGQGRRRCPADHAQRVVRLPVEQHRRCRRSADRRSVGGLPADPRRPSEREPRQPDPPSAARPGRLVPERSFTHEADLTAQYVALSRRHDRRGRSVGDSGCRTARPCLGGDGQEDPRPLNRATFSSGQRMVLEVQPPRTEAGVHGSHHRHPWAGVEADPRLESPAAVDRHCRGSGDGSVTAKVVRPDGRVVHDPDYHVRLHYTVHGLRGMRGPLVGMGAQKNWAQRLSEVGPGVAARRIFADLSVGATSQIKLVEEAHRAGMLPVISYEVGSDVAGAVNGKYNAVAQQAAAQLASYGLPTAVVFWHEPYGDMSGCGLRRREPAAAADLQARQPAGRSAAERVVAGPPGGHLRVVLPRRPVPAVGLGGHGHLPVRHTGRAPESPCPRAGSRRWRKFVASRGYPDMPLGVGEYNGWTAAAIEVPATPCSPRPTCGSAACGTTPVASARS